VPVAAGVGEMVEEETGGGVAGAVDGVEAFESEAAELVEGEVEALGAGFEEVHATGHGVDGDGGVPGLDVIERVDEAGVGAAEQYHPAIVGA